MMAQRRTSHASHATRRKREGKRSSRIRGESNNKNTGRPRRYVARKNRDEAHDTEKHAGRKRGRSEYGGKKTFVRLDTGRPRSDVARKNRDEAHDTEKHAERKRGRSVNVKRKSTRGVTSSSGTAGKVAHARTKATAPAATKHRGRSELRDVADVVRLNKYLADAGLMSRRKADDLIASGVVRVNGKVIQELGVKIRPAVDEVSVRGTPIRMQMRLLYILLNKPKDCITTTSDERGRRTVMQLLPDEIRLFPVGRLDRNTTGALLLTNDGDLANALTHPSFHAPKSYIVELGSSVTKHDIDALRRGIKLHDGLTAPCEAEVLNPPVNNSVGIVLYEGRNRQVRRMFEALGYSVRKLDRIAFANLTLDGLRRGAWRVLEEDEIRHLKKLARDSRVSPATE